MISEDRVEGAGGEHGSAGQTGDWIDRLTLPSRSDDAEDHAEDGVERRPVSRIDELASTGDVLEHLAESTQPKIPKDLSRRAVGRRARNLLRKAKKLCRAAESKKASAETVHDARTALRKVETALEVVGVMGLVDRSAADPIRATLREAERALGRERDADVLFAALDRAHKPNRGPLGELKSRVVATQRRHGKVARGILRSDATRDALRNAKRLLRGLSADNSSVALLPHQTEAHAGRRQLQRVLSYAYEKLLTLDMGPLGEPASDEVIHEARSLTRGLRYTLELVKKALPEAAKPMLAELRAMQERLGTLHDDVTALNHIGGWLAHGKLRESAELHSYIVERESSRSVRRDGFAKEWKALHAGFHDRLMALAHGSRSEEVN